MNQLYNQKIQKVINQFTSAAKSSRCFRMASISCLFVSAAALCVESGAVAGNDGGPARGEVGVTVPVAVGMEWDPGTREVGATAPGEVGVQGEALTAVAAAEWSAWVL